MKLSSLIIAAGLLFCACESQAQSAAIPDAPAPAAGAPLKFSVPTAIVVAPPTGPPPQAAKPAQTCDGPEEGVYAPANHLRADEMHGEQSAYMHNLSARILSNWNHRSRLDFSNHLGPGRYVRVRFAIRPDGSYFMPEVTRTSGSRADDEKALAAIRDVPAFPAMPVGITKPIVACITFGYNLTSEDMGTDMQWMQDSVDKKKP